MPGDVSRLTTLLDAVHAALRAGDYAALPALTTAVEALAADALPRDAAEMSRLRRRLERNDACLLATARGLRAARRRMTDIVSARSGLQTYSQTGQRQRIGATGTTLTQRF